MFVVELFSPAEHGGNRTTRKCADKSEQTPYETIMPGGIDLNFFREIRALVLKPSPLPDGLMVC